MKLIDPPSRIATRAPQLQVVAWYKAALDLRAARLQSDTSEIRFDDLAEAAAQARQAILYSKASMSQEAAEMIYRMTHEQWAQARAKANNPPIVWDFNQALLARGYIERCASALRNAFRNDINQLLSAWRSRLDQHGQPLESQDRSSP